MIASIILAGGASERMGTPKALLQYRNKPFLVHITNAIKAANIEETVLVVGAHAEEIRKATPWFAGKTIVNSRWQEGQLTSLQAGIRALDWSKVDGLLVWPVDHPLVAPATACDLVRQFERSASKIIIPTWHERRGHPVIFPRAMIDALLDAPVNVGARAVLRDHADLILHVATEDEGVVADIDTPEEYDRHCRS